MFARISVLLIALTLLAVPAAVQAGKSTAKPVKKFAIATSSLADQLDDKVIQPLAAGFAVPKGVAPAAACKGKLTISAPAGTKIVKKKGKKVKVKLVVKKTGKLSAGTDGRCSAAVTLKLPSTAINAKVKFTTKFKGNSVVKPFVKSKKLLVALKPPAPVLPPTLRQGPWTMTETGASGTPRQWGFTVGPGNTITKRTERYGTINVHCPGPHADRILDDSPSNEAPFDDANTITTYPVNLVDQWTNSFDTEEHVTQTFNLTFISDVSGTGTFNVTGTLRATSLIAAPPDLVAGCYSDTIGVKFEYGAAM